MLGAQRRILKPGGRLAFFAIAVADNLTIDERRIALDAGPEHTGTADGYPALLDAAGFEDVEFVDVTGEYHLTLQAWIREWETEAAGIMALLGVGEFAERQERRRTAQAAIEASLLQRWLISARRDPGAPTP